MSAAYAALNIVVVAAIPSANDATTTTATDRIPRKPRML
jgi:hypothetical protein